MVGRDCYLWRGYVIKSSPGQWNFKTRNESEVLKYVNLHAGSQHFTELIADVTVDNRVFLLLRYIPFPDLSRLFYKRKWQAFKLLPGTIRTVEQEGQIILGKLSQLGIVHRDIMPGNLLFDFWRRRLILIDFGFAIYEGKEIQTGNQETQELLEYTVKHNLGGKYRKPDAEFGYDTDRYSLEKFMQELRQISPWIRLPI